MKRTLGGILVGVAIAVTVLGLVIVAYSLKEIP